MAEPDSSAGRDDSVTSTTLPSGACEDSVGIDVAETLGLHDDGSLSSLPVLDASAMEKDVPAQQVQQQFCPVSSQSSGQAGLAAGSNLSFSSALENRPRRLMSEAEAISIDALIGLSAEPDKGQGSQLAPTLPSSQLVDSPSVSARAPSVAAAKHSELSSTRPPTSATSAIPPPPSIPSLSSSATGSMGVKKTIPSSSSLLVSSHPPSTPLSIPSSCTASIASQKTIPSSSLLSATPPSIPDVTTPIITPSLPRAGHQINLPASTLTVLGEAASLSVVHGARCPQASPAVGTTAAPAATTSTTSLTTNPQASTTVEAAKTSVSSAATAAAMSGLSLPTSLAGTVTSAPAAVTAAKVTFSSTTTTAATSATVSSSTSAGGTSTNSSASEPASVTVPSSEASTKGIDMQLFQLLQANFPNLKLDAFKSIFQVNSLISQTLQHQQQQLQRQQQQQQKQKQKKLVPLARAPGKSSASDVKRQSQPQLPQIIKFGGRSVTNTALKFTEEGLAGTDAKVGSTPPTVKIGGESSSSNTGVGVAQVPSSAPSQTIKISGRSVSNATLKLGEDGLSGIDVGRSTSPTIKIGGESYNSGSNLIMSRSGPVKVKSLFPSSSSVTSSSSAGSSTATSTSVSSDKTLEDKASRTPVFAQILANLKLQGGTIGSMVKNVVGSTATAKSQTMSSQPKKTPQSGPKAAPTPGFTSPLVLSRQRDLPVTQAATITSVPSTQLAPISGPTSPPSSSSSKRTAAKHQRAQLSQILVEQEAVELMDVDVGKPFQMLELPPHLKDHSYSCYNPEEGDKMVVGDVGKGKGYRVSSSTIPPARVSYAPQVPDSPTTLYKLLKVIPRKQGRHSSIQGSSRTSGATLASLASGSLAGLVTANRVKKRKGYFTPSGGYVRNNRKAKGGRSFRGVVGSRGSSNPSSRAESEDPEGSFSSSDQSDDDTGSRTSLELLEAAQNRRRSERTAGQRKRYVDDLNLAFSDEELQEDIMNPRPLTKKEYRGYGEEDDWDFEGVRATGDQPPRSSKHKTKTVCINPTEGFQYSDIYFEPPAEEANIVDRILLTRTRKTESEEEVVKYGEQVEEFLVKYKNYSYLHTKWATADHILVGDKRFDGKVKRYKAKVASLGSFANLDEEPFNPEYTVVDRILDVATQTETNNEVVTHYLVKWRCLPYEDATWELEEDVDNESIRKYNLLHVLPPEDEIEFNPRPPPNAFKPLKAPMWYKDGNELRPYQLEGINWLLFNWYARQNCILADEMGLGKTVQSIALLLEVMKAGIRGPFLIIAPLSTITNWQREFEAWTDINIVVYHGSAYSRRLIHEYELYYRDCERKVISDAFKFNAVITTYEVMLSDESELQAIQWRVVVIDEAHRLKNRNCKLLEELRTLDMEHRILLTGTPLQNTVEELFSLLNFLEPSTFPSHVAFLQQFGDLKTEEQVEELKSILKPMMLRRLKEDVEKSLAPKEETIVEVELTVIQKQYYRAILERNFTFLSKGPGSGSCVPSLLNVVMELRKCCNHPYLIQGAEHQIVCDFQARHPNMTVTSALVQASGKMVLVDKLLTKLWESGHKVLIFSQMVRCLDILEDFLRLKGYFYERIDGNVRGIHRQEAIDRFSKPNSDRFVFLLCTRAGGLGINLTAADTVIIYDSDWNPQNDLQAQARCHRIGQNKSVKIYRLITRNTYEREMFDRASLKLGLDKAVLQSMQHQSNSGNGAPQMSKKEVEDLLKKGAYGAVMDEDDDANKFCEEDIDQILERRAHVIQLESEGSGSTFSKASFAADGSSDINVDDPDFWKKWAEKANLDLDELANKDSLVLDTPRLRRQVRRYGNDGFEEIVEMSDVIDDVIDEIPSTGKHSWTKLECLKVEKGLLVYGWREWKSILRYGKFRKRKLGIRDVETIARNILMYCLAHFTGDNQVPPYVTRLLDPAYITENPPNEEESLYYEFSSEDFQILQENEPETLFQDVTYMKHLRRHANRILLRTRQLHIMRWSIFIDYMDDIMKGTPAKSLRLDLPKPEEPPPAPWWNTECDYSLLVGILKHGYEQFGPMRSDPALCFKAMCGEELPGPKKKKSKKNTGKGLGGVKGSRSMHDAMDIGEGFDSDCSESGEDSDGGGDSGPATPMTPNSKALLSTKRITRGGGFTADFKVGGVYVWPGLAEVNTRARRYVSAWIRHQKREETRLAYIQKERERKERTAAASRRKELKKAELAQKWSKREELDFVRVISFFGVDFKRSLNRYDWVRFRQLASLGKKSDERLTLYLHDFKQMCWRVLKKKNMKLGLSGVRVDPISEEKASRILLRINLLSAIREEIIPHLQFDELIQLCEVSFEVPQWWLPGTHDTDLLRGVAKHGLYRSNQFIYNDPELCFKRTVPQTALFDASTSQVVEGEDDDGGDRDMRLEEGDGGRPASRDGSEPSVGGGGGAGDGGVARGSDEEDEEEVKQRLSSSGVILPLGWPKEKAMVIRMTRIVYAFRNKVWPKPMEGLDLFTPVVNKDDSSSESSDDEEVLGMVGWRGLEEEWNATWSGSDGEYDVVGRVDPTSRKNRPRRVVAASRLVARRHDEDSFVDIEGGEEEVKDFEIERTQGLKMTLKKSNPMAAFGRESPPLQLEVKIPLVRLTFPGASGLKRIPKKRPAPSSSYSPTSATPDAKKIKIEVSKSSYFKIVDPSVVAFSELTGHERVGVINRNTKEKLPARQSPMLKNLRLWLEGHPHYNVEADWGPLVLKWGALKPDMFTRILQK